MVFIDIDTNSGNGNIEVEVKKSLETTVEDISNYFSSSGEINSAKPSVILPTEINRKKRYYLSLDKIQNYSWPDILKTDYHDIYYNLDSSCEELEANIINKVKFDTDSIFRSSKLHSSKLQNTMSVVHSKKKKRDVCELLFSSPERNQFSDQNLQPLSKRVKRIRRSDLSCISQVRQIAIVTGKRNASKKIVKECFKKNFEIAFEDDRNSLFSSTDKSESDESTQSCRKCLFTNKIENVVTSKCKQISQHSSLPTLPENQNLSLRWSIKKNRPANVIKPKMKLNVEKCALTAELSKQKLSFRKGLQKTMFMNETAITDTSNQNQNCTKTETCMRSMEKSIFTLDSESLEDMHKDGQSAHDDLSELHKKKLREAVANALEVHNITLNHPSFRTHGRNLFSICKVHLKDVLGKGKTSAQMKLLAESHVQKVISQEDKKP